MDIKKLVKTHKKEKVCNMADRMLLSEWYSNPRCAHGATGSGGGSG